MLAMAGDEGKMKKRTGEFDMKMKTTGEGG